MRRLLIRPGAIGDCILSFPALEHLRTEYTSVWISSAVVPVVLFADEVRSIASTGLELTGVGDLEMPATLRRYLESFDSIVSWYGANRAPFREALLSVGVTCDFHSALPPPDCQKPATDFFAAQVGAPTGLRPTIRLNHQPQRNSVVIHPFSGSARKNWPLEKFRALSEQLSLDVEWTCGPDEQLNGATRFDNLLDLAEWIAGARLYIGNDSGITHLAAAVGTPTLALFGSASPPMWEPQAANAMVLRTSRIESLGIEEVLKSANRLLGLP